MMRDDTATGPQPVVLDPLDEQLGRVTAAGGGAPAVATAVRGRLAFGWSSGAVSAMLLLGMALGGQGLGVLSPNVLALLDPAIPVALAALGVLVGLGIRITGRREMRLGFAATVEATLTGAIVGAGFLFALPPETSAPLPPWLLALAVGICASTSAALLSDEAFSGARASRGISDLDGVWPIIVGGIALAFLREGSLIVALSTAGQAAAVALVIAIAGWLLLARPASGTAQRVFFVAILLLLGGAADYLSLSALLGGLVAGVFWQVTGGTTREQIGRDLMYVQHPLLAVILLDAGARAHVSPLLLALAGVYIPLRACGKLAGVLLARRVARRESPPDLAFRLMAPGILAVAFALNALRAIGSDAGHVVTIAVLGTIGSELFAGFSRPPGRTQ